MSAPLRGKQIAFTGTFENMNRAAVVAKAKAAGALVLGRGSSVSKNIDFLVTGDSNVGVKKVKAKQLGITVVPPHSFLNFVKAGGAARMTASSTPAMRKTRATMEESDDMEESSAAMPWETEASATKTVRRVAPAVARRQEMVKEDFEQDYEMEETSGAMPWETEAPVAARGRTRMMSAPKARIERPVRESRTQMVAKPGRRVAAAPAAPFWNLRNKNVAFTGSFDQMKKTEAIVMAERCGATVMNGLGAQIDILICGKGSEAKRMLAKKKGIKAVGEQTFIAACRQ